MVMDGDGFYSTQLQPDNAVRHPVRHPVRRGVWRSGCNGFPCIPLGLFLEAASWGILIRYI